MSRIRVKHYRGLVRSCTQCGVTWQGIGGGGKRDVCLDCYPLKRQASQLFYAARQRAKASELEFDLTIDDLMTRLRKPCPRTGVAFTILSTGLNYKDRNPFSPSIDKIDPEAGYTKSNIQVVCWWYNLAKSRHSDEEVLELCKRVIANS